MSSSKTKIGLLGSTAAVAGIAEAVLLAIIAALAGALSQGQERVDLAVGAISIRAELSLLFGVAIGLALIRGGLQVFLAYLPARMSSEVMASLRKRLFDTFLDSSWALKASQRDGYYQSLMNLHVTTAAQAVIILGTGITASIMFASLLASAFVLSLATALALIAISLILFVGLRPLSRLLRRQAKLLSAESVEYSKGVQEIVLMAEETEVFGASPSYRSSFYKLIDHVRTPLMRTRFLSRAIPALYQSVALLMLVLALIGIAILGTGASQFATLGAVVLLLVRSLTYGQQIQTALTSLDEAVPFMNRLSMAIDDYSAQARRDGGEELPPISQVAMRNVRFGYPGGPEVLRGLDFSVERGEAIGIAGPSGAGKSSVVQLLLRLREPTSGEVLINGRDAQVFRRDQWQGRVAYVPQTPQVVWGTVSENIRFYRPELTQADVELAARRANIHDEIVSWPDGYDTVVGQRAAAVSGGQRQRLCLARALCGHPDVLILDEATSALDVKSESLVQETLLALKREVTLFIVGHRLSTLSFCDRIMVVREGVIEHFEHASTLLEENDFYREVDEISRRQAKS